MLLLFCSSLLTGVVPHNWRIANTIPIYKYGNHQIPANYRPISLTSLVSKLFEKIVTVTVAFHMINHLAYFMICNTVFTVVL